MRVYDEVITNHDVVKDFINTIGLDVNDNWIYPSRDKSNITLNKYIIEFLRRTNHINFTKEEFNLLKQFLATESSIRSGPKAIYLTTEERRTILQKASFSNRYIARKYFNRNYLFPKLEEIEVPDTLTDEMYEKVLLELASSEKYRNKVGKKIISYI